MFLRRLRLMIAMFLMALPLLVLATAFTLQTAPADWVNYLVFAIFTPLVIQGLRLLAAKGVKVEVRGWVAKIASLVLSVLAVYLMGGFDTIVIPTWTGDVVFVGQFLAFLVACWAPVQLMYGLVVKPIEGAVPALKV